MAELQRASYKGLSPLPGIKFEDDEGLVVSRSNVFTLLAANAEENESGVVSRDVIIDKSLGVWARIYLPQEAKEKKMKLPVIVYMHGGGFVIHSPDVTDMHHLCNSMAKHTGAIVVSLNYRLSPEHRLPAAYDDAWMAIKWLQSVHVGGRDEEWVRSYGDPSKTFIAGDSAGGNIAHHLSMRILTSPSTAIAPLVFVGEILMQPFFGGRKSVESEMRTLNDQNFTKAAKCCWHMALPEGSHMDHPYASPVSNMSLEEKSAVQLLPKCVVFTGGSDPLYDWQVEYVQEMRNLGVNELKAVEYSSADHGFYCHMENKFTSMLLDELADFVKI